MVGGAGSHDEGLHRDTAVRHDDRHEAEPFLAGNQLNQVHQMHPDPLVLDRFEQLDVAASVDQATWAARMSHARAGHAWVSRARVSHALVGSADAGVGNKQGSVRFRLRIRLATAASARNMTLSCIILQGSAEPNRAEERGGEHTGAVGRRDGGCR